MRLTFLFFFIGLMHLSASVYSQTTKLSLKMRNAQVAEVLDAIERQSEFRFAYSPGYINLNRKVDVSISNKTIDESLHEIFAGTGVKYGVYDRHIILYPEGMENKSERSSVIHSVVQQQTVSGVVTDQNGQPLPGVTVLVKGTTIGTVTDLNGNFSLSLPAGAEILQFSFVGMRTQEVAIGGRTTFNMVMEEEIIGLEEVVAVGYGTMKKSDVTGSVIRVNEKIINERQGVSALQSIQGAVPGLNIGQVNRAGTGPAYSIRGQTTISGAQSPLTVVDGVIYRGDIIDINPSDIETIDILKDASSTAIYGSQAANGVIIITTKTGQRDRKPVISVNSKYTYQTPVSELVPESPEQFVNRAMAGYFLESRTKESGYLETKPGWSFEQLLKDNEQIRAYENNLPFDWYDFLTNNNMNTHSHNVSLQQRIENSGYFISIGYTDQAGYMINEDYTRWNARINFDNTINDWMKVGVQLFMTLSDLSGAEIPLEKRYLEGWYHPPYKADGTINPYPSAANNSPNAILVINSDDYKKRYNTFGNIYAEIKLPFIKGLSFKPNFNINYATNSLYSFKSYENNFIGEGSKYESRTTRMTNDNILSYIRTFKDIHSVNITLVQGLEKIVSSSTRATASNFISKELGYNRLQAGDASMQKVSSGASEESSLYNMARVFYGFKHKYLFTGTIRKDGFSGFAENYKYGVFPSASVAWVISEESFLNSSNWIDNLKIRLSYGSNGNRTLGSYQTLAKVSGRYGYINGEGKPVYTQNINSLASPNLKWETTTGFNVGTDFSVFNNRINGFIDYYNNNTHNLLYNVDIPSISRFTNFPDNLGKIHNFGVETTVSSVNIQSVNFEWNSSLNFSLNRNKLVALLGIDADGDGVEDDLISEGLFIGHPLNVVYDYYTTGEIYQVDEYLTGTIPSTADIGSYKILDYNGNGAIEPFDKHILGSRDPMFRFSIDNSFRYKNWQVSFFVNSIVGNKKFYLGKDDLSGLVSPSSNQFDNRNMPKPEIADFWLPENPDGRYQRMGVSVSSGLLAERYIPRTFVRLQDLNLSYTFDRLFLEKTFLQDLRVFFNAKNLLTLTKWPGWDPETGDNITRWGRPVLKGYTLGLEVKF